MAARPRQATRSADPPDTVVRVLTPVAAGAIAVVQIAGPCALDAGQIVFRPRGSRTLGNCPPGRVLYGDVLDRDGEVLDDALAIRGCSAGQPWLELDLHGSVRIVQRLIRRLQDLGVGYAASTISDGEQAGVPAAAVPDHSFDWLGPLEAWVQRCLPVAATPRVVRWLARQARLWQEQVRIWRDAILCGQQSHVLTQLFEMLEPATLRLGGAWRGRTVAILGPPQAGKSTLANRLAGRGLAIVSEAPGTTRDWVDGLIAVQGWPVTLVDTAGARPTADPLEAEAIARGLARARAADVRLLVFDATDAMSLVSPLLAERIRLESFDILVWNKCDLLASSRHDGGEGLPAAPSAVRVSASTGLNWTALESVILSVSGFAALQHDKPLVFCAELQCSVADLAAALRTPRAHGALMVLDHLLAAGPATADKDVHQPQA